MFPNVSKLLFKFKTIIGRGIYTFFNKFIDVVCIKSPKNCNIKNITFASQNIKIMKLFSKLLWLLLQFKIIAVFIEIQNYCAFCSNSN